MDITPDGSVSCDRVYEISSRIPSFDHDAGLCPPWRDNRTMRVEGEPYPIIPHEDVEKVDCCGCLVVVERGDQADLTCNECGAVVRTVPADKAVSTLAEMESAEICSAR